MPYLGKQSEQVGVSVQKYEFLQGTDSSSGATSFSVPSDSGDHLNVWLNGVLLVEGAAKDYTTTNTTVDFVTAPADDDIVRIDVVESFNLPDALKASGDTMSGTLKLNGGIQQQTSADLSGTYAYHQLMLSDAFTVAGDVTISDNLVLAKLSDDSNAITISNDTSTRTITGTGSLEASTLAQTPNASLTGMTGEIGSAVTGSPNLNLGNATFPAGVMVGFQKGAWGGGSWSGSSLTTTSFTASAAGTGATGTDITFVHTPKAAGNIIYLSAATSFYMNNRSYDMKATWSVGQTSAARGSDVNLHNLATGSGGMGQSEAEAWYNHEFGGSANDDFPANGNIECWYVAQAAVSYTFIMHVWVSGDTSYVTRQVAKLMEIQG
tara:strand:- start:16 stop:1152 length:1137 start_codon:yes stop_codon:yes gene_type:complete